MIAEALEAGVPCRWVTADCVYGGDSRFRRLLEAHSLSYVVAVTRAQKLRSLDPGLQEVRDDADQFAETDWRELSCGRGTKGERLFRWAEHLFGRPWTDDTGVTF